MELKIHNTKLILMPSRWHSHVFSLKRVGILESGQLFLLFEIKTCGRHNGEKLYTRNVLCAREKNENSVILYAKLLCKQLNTTSRNFQQNTAARGVVGDYPGAASDDATTRRRADGGWVWIEDCKLRA